MDVLVLCSSSFCGKIYIIVNLFTVLNSVALSNFLICNLTTASLVAQVVKNPPAVRETWIRSLGWEDPLEEGLATHASIPAWRIPMDSGAWQATVHGILQARILEWVAVPFSRGSSQARDRIQVSRTAG